MRGVAAVCLLIAGLLLGTLLAAPLALGTGESLDPPPVSRGGPVLSPPLVDPDAIAAPAPGTEEPRWPSRPSRALGKPFAGALAGGVQLPAFGDDYVTWDPVLRQVPNRGWRRWATDRLLRTLLRVFHEYRAAHPDAMPLVVGDLSRPHGGPFGRRFGGKGHASHQNGLDADVFYPRRDRRLEAATRVGEIDHALAQDLVDRFVAAGAQFVFVGPHTGLRGPSRIVQTLVLHDDHMHVRIHPAGGGTGGGPAGGD